jgi:hypothetical protein
MMAARLDIEKGFEAAVEACVTGHNEVAAAALPSSFSFLISAFLPYRREVSHDFSLSGGSPVRWIRSATISFANAGIGSVPAWRI